MPVLNIKVEGRGNGIKTVIPNMEDIARALARPPTYPTKFFGCELGAQTSFANDRYIVNGSHTADRLRELLDAFIEKFVLCPSCKNPETELVITGKGANEDIHRDCKACGKQNGIDMRHKLTTYILKNPPNDKKGGGKSKKGGKGMTAEANVGGPMVFEKGTNGTNGINGTNGHSNGDHTPEEDLPQSPDLSSSPKASTASTFGVPTSGTDIDAALGRSDPILDNPDKAEEVSKKLKSLEVNDDDDEDDADSPYAILGGWLVDNRDKSNEEIIKKINELGVFGKYKVLVEVGEKLFGDDIVKELGKRITLLKVVSFPFP